MVFFFSSRRRQTRCALVTGVQTCALPISWLEASGIEEGPLFRRVGVDRRRVRASDSETALARTTYSIGTAPLTRQGVNGIYRRVALAAFELGLVSLPASELTAAVQALSTHSLRVGLTQDLFAAGEDGAGIAQALRDRKSTRLNSSH